MLMKGHWQVTELYIIVAFSNTRKINSLIPGLLNPIKEQSLWGSLSISSGRPGLGWLLMSSSLPYMNFPDEIRSPDYFPGGWEEHSPN